jgi:methyl-accepting chemotaxis protein
MSSDTLTLLLAVSVALSATAILLQVLVMFGIYRTMRESAAKFDALAKQWEGRLEEIRLRVIEVAVTAGEVAGTARDVAARTNEVLALAKVQLGKVDVVLSDATQRARSQVDRVELVVNETIDRFEEISAALNKGILRPIREVNGVLAGLQTGLAQLIRGSRRRSVAQATQDDEMFI